MKQIKIILDKDINTAENKVNEFCKGHDVEKISMFVTSSEFIFCLVYSENVESTDSGSLKHPKQSGVWVRDPVSLGYRCSICNKIMHVPEGICPRCGNQMTLDIYK